MPLILVADDRSVNRQLMVSLLRYGGHEIVEAESGEETVQLALARRPDLIVLDQLMPGMHGLAVVQRLRELPALKDVPIVFHSSAWNESEAGQEASRLGVAAVLAKPSEPAAILKTVDRILRERGVIAADCGTGPGPAALGLDFGLAHLVELGLDLAAEDDRRRMIELFSQRALQALASERIAVSTEGRLHVADAARHEWLPAAPERIEALHFGMHFRLTRRIRTARGSYGDWMAARSDRPFDESDERLASTLAAQLALAYENIRLREELDVALRRSNALISAVFECAPPAIIVLGRDGRIEDWNAGAERMFFWSREEVVGRSATLAPERGMPEFDELWDRVFRRGETIAGTPLRRFRRDGSPIEVSLAAAPLNDPETGARRGVVAVVSDMTSIHQAQEESRQRSEELAALSSRLLHVQEAERTRIAREIHDELGQLMTAAKVALRSPGGARIDDAVALLDQTVQAIRRIASELRPSALDEFGLVPALENELAVFQERTGIAVDASFPGDFDLDHACTTTLFRIAQEAITNVARHAAATRVEVRMRQSGRDVVLSIRDDGLGLAPEAIASTRSLGLIGMRERARHLGGQLAIEGVPERGTIVTVRLPLRRSA